MLNFSTVPQWMYKVEKPVPYPEDPDKPIWDYVQGTELRDPSMKEIGDYYGRLFSWYTDGGFTDEVGKRHESGYHYSIPLWEVLNEVDFEHDTKADTYTRMYDSIVGSIRKVKPDTKFVGMSLGAPHEIPDFFEYFLNPKNHKSGIPLDYISYHFYAIPAPDQGPEIQEHVFFAQADGFLKGVGYVELIRKRLSPSTRTTINEVGSISADDVKMVYEKGHSRSHSRFLLELDQCDVRVCLRGIVEDRYRSGKHVAVGWISHPIPQRVYRGLDYGKTKHSLSDAPVIER